jgi:hypothetical protein
MKDEGTAEDAVIPVFKTYAEEEQVLCVQNFGSI